MLSIQSLTYLQYGNPLLENVNLQVSVNHRLGLIGKNGCGKSTLFRLIRGILKPDSGEIKLHAGKNIAFVEQEIINSSQPAIEFVLDGDIELRQLEKILAQIEHDVVWFEAQQRYETINGYMAQARAAQLLNGLGFANTVLDKPVNHFSGGWRMRLNLARALMHRADLLLLDEPTNHLDLEAILWLEQYLARYPGSLIIVSHDREFLNSCVNRIAHINNRKIDSYSGNYDDFEHTRTERLIGHTQAFQQQQKKIAHMEDFVRRFRAKASKAKQAQSRIKALERLILLGPAYIEDGHIELQIVAPEHSPNVLLRATNVSFGYDHHLVLQQIHFILQAGTRIALVGPNGTGKSTLIKLLAGKIKPISGSLEWTKNIRIGYFAQHQLDNLDNHTTPLQHMRQLAPAQTDIDLRKFLGQFGLGSNQEDRPISSFSGGEKSRLALALLAWQKPHLLLLDEPTNHLDLDMRNALILTLEAYTGAVVLISHDRSLVRAVADELWLVADGRAQFLNGDLEDYKNWVQARHTKETPETQPFPQKIRVKKSAKLNKKTLLSKQSKLETELMTVQGELDEVNRQLSDPSTYMNYTRDKIDQLNKTRAAIEKKVSELEEAWLELEISLEE